MTNIRTHKFAASLVMASSLTLLGLAGGAHADSSDWTSPAMTDNAPTCNVTTVGGDDLTGEFPTGRIAENGPEVTGQLVVTGDSNCKVDVTLTTWSAPNSFDGKPYDQQSVFETKTLQFSVGTHDITVHLPGCYYQADLVRGDAAAGYNGSPIYEPGRMIASLHGGSTSCDTTCGNGSGTPVTPVIPVTPVTPVTPVMPVTPVTPVAPTTPVETTPVTTPAPSSGGSVLGASTTPAPTPAPAALPATGGSDLELIIAASAGVIGGLVRKYRKA